MKPETHWEDCEKDHHYCALEKFRTAQASLIATQKERDEAIRVRNESIIANNTERYRAEKAEQALRGEPVAWLKEWRNDVGVECERVDLHETCEPWMANRNPKVTPLYAAPISGEPVARMPNEPTLPMLDAALRWMRSNPASMNAASCEYENVQHIYSAMRAAAPLYAAPISGERVREALDPTLDEKNATLTMQLIAESGFESQSEHRISARQWGAINAAIESALPLAAQPEGK